MKLHLDILPEAQLALWPELKFIPDTFTLYGGTAIALQLGHRKSVDFDFFSAHPLNKTALIEQLPFLANAKLVHPEINTLNCFVESPQGIVKLQFLAGLENRLGKIENIIHAEGNNLQIASLRDLFGTKLNTIQARAEMKDYIDIDALMQHGLTLAEGLACAEAIYGTHYDVATSLRALCSFRDGDLPQLDNDIKDRLAHAATQIDDVPTVSPISNTIN